jgi:hypothetical protein
MNKFTVTLVAVIGAAVVQNASALKLDVFVAGSSAPNYSSSMSFDGVPPDYAANALSALAMGQSSFGTANYPTYYQQQSTFTAGDIMISSGFTSWKGQANPTGNFANEYGNRLHFGLHITGDGTLFKLANLSFVYSDVDAFTGTGSGQLPLGELGFSGDFKNWNGWNVYGVGIKADGSYASSVNDDLKEFYYVGVGNAFVAEQHPIFDDQGNFVRWETPQEALDALADSINGKGNAIEQAVADDVLSISTAYALTANDGQNYSGSATAYRRKAVPDAGLTLTLLGFSSLLLAVVRHRRLF